MINSEHYPAEKHTVTTKDGYYLSIYRIPNLNKQKNNRKVILFMHGEMNSMNYSKYMHIIMISSFFFVVSFFVLMLIKSQLDSFALYSDSDQDFLKIQYICFFVDEKRNIQTITLSPISIRYDKCCTSFLNIWSKSIGRV